MTQEFYISVTPIRNDEYLVRTERVAPGVPLAEEQVTWPVADWLKQASQLMDDPLNGLLRSESLVPLLQPSPVGAGASTSTQYVSDTARNLVSLGQRLYNALFQGTIRDSWVIAQGVAQHRGEPLRLRLGLKGTQLHRLPWEVLHAGDRPLATGTDIVFSRYHSDFSVFNAPVVQKSAWEEAQPLKILMVLAAPKDQDFLKLKQEALRLQDELQTVMRDGGQRCTSIQLTLLEQPGSEQLTQALEQNHYQVLHYAGHSNLGMAGGNLYLVNSTTGLTETLSGDDLAGLLVNNGIRMAVFNSCRGVYGASSDPETQAESGNLAEALVKRGIPAVLAMSDRIPDHVALNLSQLFYRNLKKASSIDLCLSRARQGLIASYTSEKFYWALPILYLHPDFDGYLQASAPEESSRYFGRDISPVEDILSQPDNEFDPEDLYDDDDLYDLEIGVPEPDPIPGLVKELLPSDQAILPAPPNEELLPPATQPSGGYLTFPDEPERESRQTQPSRGPLTETAASPHPRNVFKELEPVLADMGKLTPDLLASGRAVENNPYEAQAHANLGWALHQHGYPTEAIAAYQQALTLNSRLAETHHRLGQALYQQGKVAEAIAAYNQAILLDPTLVGARTHLTRALQGCLPDSSSSSSDENPPPRGSVLYIPKRWVRRGVVGLAVLSLVGLGVSTGLLPQAGAWMVETSRRISDRLLPSEFNSKQVAEQADRQLKQSDLAGFQKSVVTLLDHQAFPAAEPLLKSALAQHQQDAELQFLMGRVVWQAAQPQPSTAQLQAAAQHWRDAVNLTQKTNPRYLNALGFANYAQANWASARSVWFQTIEQQARQVPASRDASPSSQKLSHETLTAYAGIALAYWQLAEGASPAEQKILRTEAIKARDSVMAQDRDRFQPEALGQDWQWHPAAIQDWRSLLTQPAPAQ